MLLREQVHRGPVLREQALVLQLGVRLTYQTRGELLGKLLACKVLVPRRTVDQMVREDHTQELVALRAVHQLVKDQTEFLDQRKVPIHHQVLLLRRGHLVQRREPILEIGTAVGKTRLGPTGDVPRMLAMVRLKEVVEVRNPRMRRCFNEASVGCRHHQSQNTRVGAVGYRR